MVLRCRTSELTQIYEAVLESAIDRSRWPVALDRITKAADGIGAIFTAVSFNQPDHGFLISSGLDEELGRLFLKRYQDNVLTRAMMEVPPASAIEQTALVSLKTFRRAAFHSDIFVPQRIKSQVAMSLPISKQADTGGVAVSLDGGSVRKVRRAVDLLNAIAPALKHASAAAIRLPPSDLSVSKVLETLPTAALIVDVKGSVVLMNTKAQALVRAGDGFDVRRRCLFVHERADHSALMRLIREATVTPLGRSPSGIACRVHRANGKFPLVVHVTAMRDPHEQVVRPGVSHAIVFFSRPEDDAEHSNASELRLRALFNMTPAETRVALGIAKGKNIPEVAQQLGVGEGTVHTHLHGVFEKTGVRRQSALARMLTRTGILDMP